MPRKKKHSFRVLKKGISRLSRWTMGVILLPLAWGLSLGLYQVAFSVTQSGWKTLWIYLVGAGFYFVIEKWVAKPMWLYVFGHESTHVVSGLLTGAKIHSFKATSKGGEVHLSKSNAFIALSPYILPFYTAVIILLYALVRHFWTHPYLLPSFQFLMGATLMFHISMTFSAVHHHQPDLKVLGLFLSGVLIFIGNILILGLLGVTLFQSAPKMRDYMKTVAKETGYAWVKIIEKGQEWIR
ncbi:MAG: hypothetical protein ACKVQC_01930 [Elusimicrobiota bacterium]